MRCKRLTLTILLLLGFLLTGLKAQESVNTAGGDIKGSEGSVNYTIGQVAYTYSKGETGSVTRGVQQSFTISVVSAVENTKGINLMVSAYPNPTTDFLTLEVRDAELLNFKFELYNMKGEILQQEIIISNQTTIVMDKLATATYFVKIMQGNLAIKTFKIIKN